MNIDHLNLIASIAATVVFCAMANWHAAVWAIIAAIAYIRILGYRK